MERPLGAAEQAEAEAPYPNPTYAWYVVGLLLVAYTVSFIDRQILALLVGPIKRDLGLSDTAFSLLTGFAFALFYTLFGLVIARIVDSRSRRGLVMAGVAFWSIMTAACGLAKGFWHLFAARVGVGIGEATLTPAANSLIADYFPPHKLGRAISVYSLGIPIGSAIAFLLGGAVIDVVEDLPPQDLPVLGPTYGWQLAFFIVGLPGVLLAIVLGTIKEPVRRGLMKGREGGLPLGEAMAYFRARWRVYGAHFTGLAGLALLGYGSTSWIIAFFQRTHGISASDAGYIFGAVLATAGIAGILAGGFWADRLLNQGKKDAHMRVLLLATALGLLPGLAFPLMPELWLAIPVLFLSAFFSNMPWGTAYAALGAITPNELRGQAAAAYLFVVNIIGYGLGPTIYALFTDFVFRDEMKLNYSFFAVTAIITPISIVIFWLGRKPFARAIEEAEARRAGAAGG